MLRIRLRRVGKKKQPMYRIVVADSRAPRDGRFVEAIGQYHPLEDPSRIVLDEERARHWLEQGALPSDRVSKIFATQGIAEIPEKLKTRMALGAERAKEAAATKAKEAAEAPPEASADADAPSVEASSEASAMAEAAGGTDEPKAEASSETSAEAEASNEAEEPKAEDTGSEQTEADAGDASATS